MSSDSKMTMYDDAKSALVFFSRFKIVIPSIILIIVSVIFIIYGIKLIFKDESKIKSTKVVITKIVNSNDLTKSCQDKIIKISSKDNVHETTVYNCNIFFNLLGIEKNIQVSDSPTNYILGQEITVWYDETNINDTPMLSYISLRPYRYMFILGGLLLIPIIIYFNYILFHNDRLAMGLGVVNIADRLLNR